MYRIAVKFNTLMCYGNGNFFSFLFKPLSVLELLQEIPININQNLLFTRIGSPQLRKRKFLSINKYNVANNNGINNREEL